ncbi:hypothetical protein [Deinococcus sp. Leaf326]|uniref:hypothetical protein n=1 Tax=Deinococcus sp. Leaf326 TaxID=1736338 RepID=UPI000ACE37DC|nr:hypothetical protein [Deinococcus sp. Leaf326]
MVPADSQYSQSLIGDWEFDLLLQYYAAPIQNYPSQSLYSQYSQLFFKPKREEEKKKGLRKMGRDRDIRGGRLRSGLGILGI